MWREEVDEGEVSHLRCHCRRSDGGLGEDGGEGLVDDAQDDD